MNTFFYKVMALYSTHTTSPIVSSSSSIITKKSPLTMPTPIKINCSFNFYN